MQVNTDVQETGAPDIQVDWEQVQNWVGAVFTKDRVVEIIFCIANVSVIGAIIFALNKAGEISAYTGLGYTAFGHF